MDTIGLPKELKYASISRDKIETRATSVILSPHIVLILFESENKILYGRRNENSTCKKDKVFKIEIEIWVAKNL